MFDIKTIRADFPILEKTIHGKPLVYLDNAATTQKPVVVLETIATFYRQKNSNIHRGVHYLSEQASSAYEAARETVRHFIHAQSLAEVVFTSGTTSAINLVADSFGRAFLREGDEIIVSEMEHHSNIVPWQLLCERTGTKLKVLPFADDGTLNPADLTDLISPRTKLIALTYVSNALGTVNPVKKLIKIAHEHEIPVLIDGAQAIQHLPIDVQALDCDFFVFSGHKIYAETGIGVLYGKEKYLEVMPPWQGGGGMIQSVQFEKTTWAELPLKFEAGTMNYVGAVSLAAALDYLTRIGLTDIAAHEQNLLNYAVEQLQTVDAITIYGNPPKRCGAVSFNLEKIHPYDAGMILDKLGIAVRTGTHCAEPVIRHYGITGTIRASVALYNTRDEIDQLIDGIRRVQRLL